VYWQLSSKIVIGIAVIASHWMCPFGSFNELSSVPFGTIVISAATSGTITTRDELSQVLVATAAGPPHRSNVIAVEHVLHSVNTKKAVIIWAVMAMKIIISILNVQECPIRLRIIPANC
jgi:hypothetical protein